MPIQLNRWGGVHNEEVDRKAIFALKILLLVAIPTVMASTILATVYAWIQGRQYGYTVEDWQRCLVSPNKGGFGVGDQTLFTGSAVRAPGTARALSCEVPSSLVPHHPLLHFPFLPHARPPSR